VELLGRHEQDTVKRAQEWEVFFEPVVEPAQCLAPLVADDAVS
jgi:hypothetical protein